MQVAGTLLVELFPWKTSFCIALNFVNDQNLLCTVVNISNDIK